MTVSNRGQRWEVKIPFDPDELEMLGPALVVTLRANLEEWWDPRGAEPGMGALGRRFAQKSQIPALTRCFACG